MNIYYNILLFFHNKSHTEDIYIETKDNVRQEESNSAVNLPSMKLTLGVSVLKDLKLKAVQENSSYPLSLSKAG